jgi:hypothetical protein
MKKCHLSPRLAPALAFLLAAGALGLSAAEEAQAKQGSQQPAKKAPQPQPRKPPPPPKKVAPKPAFGLAGALVNPMGDLADVAAMGFSAGAFYEMPIPNLPNLAVRGTLEYAMFGAKEYDAVFSKVKSTWSHIAVVADGLYYFNPTARKGYVLGGLGFYSQTAKLESSGFMGYGASSESKSETNVGFGIGGGYWFGKSLGAEAKYSSAGDADWLQISVRWRF